MIRAELGRDGWFLLPEVLARLVMVSLAPRLEHQRGGWKGRGLAGLSPFLQSLSSPRDPLSSGGLWSSRVPGHFPWQPAAEGVKTEAERQRSWRRPRPCGHPLLLLANTIGHSKSQGPPRFKRLEMDLHAEGWKNCSWLLTWVSYYGPMSWSDMLLALFGFIIVIILVLGIIYWLTFIADEDLVLLPFTSTWQPSRTPPVAPYHPNIVISQSGLDQYSVFILLRWCQCY